MDHVIKCASMIAWLEGVAQVPLAKTAHDLSFSALEKRTVALEGRTGIASPLPFEVASWNGLVWRVWRIHSKNLHYLGRNVHVCFEQYQGMTEDVDSLFDLRRAVDCIDGGLPALKCSKCEGEEKLESGSEQACLGALIQKLSYISALQYQVFPNYTWTKSTIFMYAAALSFQIANKGPVPRPFIAPPPGWSSSNQPAGQGRIPAQAKQPRSGTRTMPPPKFQAFFAGRKRKHSSSWLSKLLFWRKKKAVDSDSSSGSSQEIFD
ncbi:hypothetical protein NLG97_g8816 [Lecanicillium saksenae]|uniref:Uncharacterized protein n=1 Tax=Lecanicillium saksenae TaxID=468837 RepID=A0ACC1QID0_9HYPO|nr:hypothetical protein NLG97_g8816 [Lecanicillium saksenae]